MTESAEKNFPAYSHLPQYMAQIPFRQQVPLSPYSRAPFTTVIATEEHIDCPSIILLLTSKLLVGLDLFNCVNRVSQRKALMHHLTLKVTTPKMTFKVS
ncbi:hypothetical protein BW691_26320 [Escherichia coli]|nr:hypothetical protein BW691_26320 [Escherichia coli]